MTSSPAQLQRIVDNLLDLVSEVRLDGTFVYASESFRTLLGYDPGALVGTSAFSLVHADDLEQVLRILAEAVERRSSGRANFRIRNAQGTYVWLETVGQLLFDARGVPSGAILSGRDTTVRRQAEDQLRQSEKLDAVAGLAGSIAHDFNNLLTAILGYADLALDEVEPMSQVRADLDEIARAARSAEALARQLLIFSRKSVPQPEPLNLNDVLARFDKPLRRMLGDEFRLDFRLSRDLGVVMADPAQLEQVLTNLVANARDAMPAGGDLTIATRAFTLERSQGRSKPAGAYNALVVSDTGCGMTADVQAQIFDPFFTTKGLEKATGLGLATVHGIVHQAGGHITVQSAAGAGATFVVALPVVARSMHELGTEDVAPKRPDTETVLFVEDNDTIRAVAARALQRDGYTVLSGRSAAEALRHMAAGPPLRLLITDIVLPGMDGRALAARLREMHPRLKVLFTSGFAEESELLKEIRAAGMPFLQKPYTMDALLRTVRRTLDASDER